jgi:hypothetical protein
MSKKSGTIKKYTNNELDQLLNRKFYEQINIALSNPRNDLEIEFRLVRNVYRRKKRIFDTNLGKERFNKTLKLLESKKDYWDKKENFFFDEYKSKSQRIRLISGKVSEAINKKVKKRETLNLRKPYMDVRLAISQEKQLKDFTSLDLASFKKIQKQRYIYTKEFVDIVLTEYKQGKKWYRQVEIETNKTLTQNSNEKYVPYALFEYLKLIITDLV